MPTKTRTAVELFISRSNQKHERVHNPCQQLIVCKTATLRAPSSISNRTWWKRYVHLSVGMWVYGCMAVWLRLLCVYECMAACVVGMRAWLYTRKTMTISWQYLYLCACHHRHHHCHAFTPTASLPHSSLRLQVAKWSAGRQLGCHIHVTDAQLRRIFIGLVVVERICF